MLLGAVISFHKDGSYDMAMPNRNHRRPLAIPDENAKVPLATSDSGTIKNLRLFGLEQASQPLCARIKVELRGRAAGGHSELVLDLANYLVPC